MDGVGYSLGGSKVVAEDAVVLGARSDQPFLTVREVPSGCRSPSLVLSLEAVSTRTGWGFDRKLTAAEVPWSVDAPHWIGFHDRDIAMDNGSVERLLTRQGHRRFALTDYRLRPALLPPRASPQTDCVPAETLGDLDGLLLGFRIGLVQGPG